MSFSQSTPQPEPPFFLMAYPDLIGEMGVDELFRSRPGSLPEALRLGVLYPGTFDPKNPYACLEHILAQYEGPSDRHVFYAAYDPHAKENFYVVRAQNVIKRPIVRDGVFDFFLETVIGFLVKNGFSRETVLQNLLPEKEVDAPIKTGKWIIAYDRSGQTAVLDFSTDPDAPGKFLRGEKTFPVLKFPVGKQAP